MQRVKKILIRTAIAISLLLLLLTLILQIPSVQKSLFSNVANRLAGKFGFDVVLEHAELEPFNGNVKFSGVLCETIGNVKVSCSDFSISGLDLIVNSDELKNATISNLEITADSFEDVQQCLIGFTSTGNEEEGSGAGDFQLDRFTIEHVRWNIAGEVVGGAELLEFSGINGVVGGIEVERIIVVDATSTTAGVLKGETAVQFVECGLRVDREGLAVNGIEVEGRDLIAEGNLFYKSVSDFEIQLNTTTTPSEFIDIAGLELGEVSGHITVTEEGISLLEVSSDKGHYVAEGFISQDLNSWNLLGQTFIEGVTVSIDARGSQDSFDGIVEIENLGALSLEATMTDSTFESTIEAIKINYDKFELTNVYSNVRGTLDLTNCSIDLISDEATLNSVVDLKSALNGEFISKGRGQLLSNSLVKRFVNPDLSLSSTNEIEWDFTKGKSDIRVETNSIRYGSIVLKDIKLKGDIEQINGTSSCKEVIYLNDGRSEVLATSLNCSALNNDKLVINSSWRSNKGVDGALVVSGTVEDEFDLRFEVITEPLSEAQTRSWFKIPVETPPIEVRGHIEGTLRDPVVSIWSHSEDLKIWGENVSDCTVNINHHRGVNMITSEVYGLGEIENSSITLFGTVSDNYINLSAAVTEIPVAYANKLLGSNTAELHGFIEGAFNIDGSIENPLISGRGFISEGSVAVPYMGTKYLLEGEILVDHDHIELNGINVYDGKGGTGFLVGTAFHESFKNWNLDINLIAENGPIEIMNIPYSPERYFYGTGYGTGDINVFGYKEHIIIEANVVTDESTEFVLPMDVASHDDWSSFVEIKDDTEIVVKEKPKSNIEVTLDINIEVTHVSEARIVFNSELGDEITGRCKGHLHIDLHDLERLEMFGELEIVEGDYAFNLKNIISKNFKAVPGGSIRWFGDPRNAHIELQTLYNTRASLRPIMPEITDATKYQIDLGLNLQGELMRPDILFDIGIPEASAQYQASLSSILSNEEELNRQAISLLVINSFLPGTWHASAVGTTGIQESSSELITAQIGHWLSGISDDVNVGIDYDSANITGDEAAIAVALSTQLFNDRLHIEGEVGTQNLYFGTTDDLQIQDIRIKYDLKEDGTLQLTGYSTQRATVPGLEGENVQGVGILFNRDFNSIKDLFKRKQEKE